jgi:hypothetical protein
MASIAFTTSRVCMPFERSTPSAAMAQTAAGASPVSQKAKSAMWLIRNHSGPERSPHFMELNTQEIVFERTRLALTGLPISPDRMARRASTSAGYQRLW